MKNDWKTTKLTQIAPKFAWEGVEIVVQYLSEVSQSEQ